MSIQPVHFLYLCSSTLKLYSQMSYNLQLLIIDQQIAMMAAYSLVPDLPHVSIIYLLQPGLWESNE